MPLRSTNHFLQKLVHTPVPPEVGFILRGTYEIAQHMRDTFLMTGTVGIIRLVVIMNNSSAEVFQRSFFQAIMTFMVCVQIQYLFFIGTENDRFAPTVDVAYCRVGVDRIRVGKK